MNKTTLFSGLLAALALTGVVFAAEPPAPHETGDLKTIMVDLGQQMTTVQMGLWLEDFEAIAAGARAVADHPHVSTEERTRIQGALGADFAKFVTADRRVHDDAIRLAEAAEASKLPDSVTRTAELQASCVACHTQFREKLKR